MKRWLPLAVAALVLVGGWLVWDRTDVLHSSPSRGDALREWFEIGWGFNRVRPGQRVALMFGTLKNVSDEPIVIQSVEEIDPPKPPGVARVTKIELVPQPQRGDPPSQAAYVIYSPGVSWKKGECYLQEVVDPAGHVIEPSRSEVHRDFMLTMLEALRPGKTRLNVGRVTYKQGARTYYQDLSIVVEMRVRRDARAMRPTSEERGCVDKAELLSPIP